MTALTDILILGLLAATVGYAFVVERRVRALMHALTELQPTVNAFSNAVDRTEGSVDKLRSVTQPLQTPRRQNRSPRTSVEYNSEPASNVLRVPVKSELIKCFFESARKVRT